MQDNKEFKATKKFPVLAAVLFIIIFGYVDYGAVLMISKAPSLVNEIFTADSTMLVLADIGVIVIDLFVGIVLAWLNWVIIWGIVENIRLIGVSVNLLNEGIEIRRRSKKAFVPNTSITHISRSLNKRSLFIVWNGAEDIMTFVISDDTFGKGAVEESDLILRERRGYVDDPKEAVEIRKGIKKFGGIFLPSRSLCDIADGIGR